MTDPTNRSAETKAHHFFRVLWLRAIYWPFCDARSRIRRGWLVQRADHYIVTMDELLAVTEGLDEHPESWDFPCHCATCRSYADG